MKDTPKHHEVYTQKTELYENLIAREDYRGELPKAINSLLHLAGKDCLELGVGTGRLAELIVPYCRSYHGYDAHAQMLIKAEEKLKKFEISNWHLGVANHRSIPLPDQSVDIILSGWSLSYVIPEEESNNWNCELKIVLQEMQRILRPRGTVLVIESLGTGQERPLPSNARLKRFYGYLENGLSYTKTVIRTDYRFHSISERNRLMGAFFSEDVMKNVMLSDSLVVPECTGLWLK